MVLVQPVTEIVLVADQTLVVAERAAAAAARDARARRAILENDAETQLRVIELVAVARVAVGDRVRVVAILRLLLLFILMVVAAGMRGSVRG